MDSLTINRVSLVTRAVRGFTEPYLVHQLVADLFPDMKERPYLYRVARVAPGGAHLLVLSRIPPRPLSEIPERAYGRANRIESKPFQPRLRAGSPIDFEIRLNATTSVDGRRTDVWDAVFRADRDDSRSPHDVYRDYLVRRLGHCAEILEVRVTERQVLRPRRGDAAERGLFFVASNLIGTLTVRDPGDLVSTIGEGVGRARAFGCGLLCLSRPGTILLRRQSPPYGL